jgi:hypothetical protein
MKILGNIILVLLLSAFSIHASEPEATIEWKFTTHDFGKVKMNQSVTVEFEFTNPGLVPLIINSVKPSCGCTVADYPKEPIAPGASGKITVKYKGSSPGYFSKSITVTTNATEPVSNLYIKGEVEK